jgi:hypothetical protein
MNATALVGLAIMIGSESCTLFRVEPFYSWNTPICWTGFILFADAVVWRARGNSWLRSATREFAALALVSIPLWVLFEGYNRIIRNWHYTGLPASRGLRYAGYAWSFATIWPAIFEGAELVSVWMVGSARGQRKHSESSSGAARASGGGVPASSDQGRAGGAGRSGGAGGSGGAGSFGWFGVLSVVAGAMMVTCPFFVSPDVARYLAAPVWLIFLLDPINAALGGESILVDLRSGRAARLTNLLLSGLLCGVLWEFWNYWSGAKWHYTVPIMEHVKIFEMPLPGYLGFPAFGVECFTMYVFVRAVAVWLMRLPLKRPAAGAATVGRRIAL